MRARTSPAMKNLDRLRHWPNIETYFTPRITNAGAEGMNSKIQKIKVTV
jgi:transposase